jgi:hypothetical protein
MVVGKSSVFISYRRRVSWQLALLVLNDLNEHHFDPFMDRKNLDSGEFDRKILSEIEAREHFIVLLEPGSLDRIGEDDDWLRREIAHALAHGRNVVPVTANGFELSRDLVLPPDVARLRSLNAVPITPEYPEAGMKRLRQFLKMPPKPASPSKAPALPPRRAGPAGAAPTSDAYRFKPKYSGLKPPTSMIPPGGPRSSGEILSGVLRGAQQATPEAPATPKTDEQIEREAERETRAPDSSA